MIRHAAALAFALAMGCTSTAPPSVDTGANPFPDGGFRDEDTGVCTTDAGNPGVPCPCDGTVPFVCGRPPAAVNYECTGGYWRTTAMPCSTDAGASADAH